MVEAAGTLHLLTPAHGGAVSQALQPLGPAWHGVASQGPLGCPRSREPDSSWPHSLDRPPPHKRPLGHALQLRSSSSSPSPSAGSPEMDLGFASSLPTSGTMDGPHEQHPALPALASPVGLPHGPPLAPASPHWRLTQLCLPSFFWPCCSHFPKFFPKPNPNFK